MIFKYIYIYIISMSKLRLSIKGKFKQIPSTMFTMYLLCLYVDSHLLQHCKTCNYDSICPYGQVCV